MKKIIITTITCFILAGVNFGQNRKLDLYLKLESGFILKAKPAYPDEDISTFNHLEIFQNGKLIFKDTTLTEYTLEDTLFPKIYNFKNHFELLVEVDSRPNKNEIYNFLIHNQILERIDTLPTFLTIPKDLDNDNKLEYVGFWQYGEVWGDTIEVTGYNPIVYYEITDKGILLDSLTTTNMNTKIYGKFWGFYYNEMIEIPTKDRDRFSKEIERIVNE